MNPHPGDPADDAVIGNEQPVHLEGDGIGGGGHHQLQRCQNRYTGLCFGRDKSGDDITGDHITGRYRQHIDDAPAADERRMTGDQPAAVGTLGGHPRRHRDRTCIGHTTAQFTGRQRGQIVLAYRGIGRCSEPGDHPVMLNPGECRCQTTTGDDLGDLGQCGDIQSGTAAVSRNGDTVQAGPGQQLPVFGRDDTAAVDLDGCGKQHRFRQDHGFFGQIGRHGSNLVTARVPCRPRSAMMLRRSMPGFADAGDVDGRLAGSLSSIDCPHRGRAKGAAGDRVVYSCGIA